MGLLLRVTVSEARWAANSVNATRSTGPKSTAGKARAALNAVTHGSTSNTLIFLKDELPEEYYAEVNRWATVMPPPWIRVTRMTISPTTNGPVEAE